MKRFFVLLCTTLGIGGVLASEIPRVVVDDEHLQMQRDAGSTPPLYEIEPGAVVEVDATNYAFRVPEQLKVHSPNSVQLILAEDQQFSATWPLAKRTLILSKGSLSPNPGSSPFRGFVSGQEGVLAIGVLDGSRFSVVWVGMFRVL